MTVNTKTIEITARVVLIYNSLTKLLAVIWASDSMSSQDIGLQFLSILVSGIVGCMPLRKVSGAIARKFYIGVAIVGVISSIVQSGYLLAIGNFHIASWFFAGLNSVVTLAYLGMIKVSREIWLDRDIG
jgi:hypothetical protein